MDIQDPERLEYFNRIPTSFHLEDEQVDRLIAATARAHNAVLVTVDQRLRNSRAVKTLWGS